MLAAMPPGVLDEWMAFERIKHDEVTAIERLAAIMQRGFRAWLFANGAKNVPHDMLEPDPERQVGDMPETMKPKQVAEKLKSFPQAW